MNSERDMSEWDAAYLLGALSADEAAEYQQYLADAPRSAKPQDFEDIPAMLDLLSPDEALALLGEQQPASLAAAAEKRRQRTRRTRVAAALASAAAFLLIGGIVGYTAVPRDSSTGVTLQAMGPGQRDGVTAALALSDESWGTRLDWNCQYTKPWATKVVGYDLVVTTKDGTEATVASWSPSGSDASNLAAATMIPKSQIRSVVIREAGTGTPLAVTTLA